MTGITEATFDRFDQVVLLTSPLINLNGIGKTIPCATC